MAYYKQLKICKIESESFAKFCIARGVDYLGIHVLEEESIGRHAGLTASINRIGGRPVIVTKIISIDMLKKIEHVYEPYGIQLHSPLSINQLLEIRKALKPTTKIFCVITNITPSEAIEKIIDISDLTIYDKSFVGGTGEATDYTHLTGLPKEKMAKIMLAGGMSPQTIHKYKAEDIGGFDAQSFARQNHRHHFARAEQLIDAAKDHTIKSLALSLTDLPIDKLNEVPPYECSRNIEYHLDYSDGSLYKSFNTAGNSIQKKFLSLDAPVTVHIFSNSEPSIQKAINHFVKLDPNKITKINIQYFPGLNLSKINTYESKTCISVYYKDLAEFNLQPRDSHDCFSFILPSDSTDLKSYLQDNHSLFEDYSNSEVWFDRDMNEEKLKMLKRYINMPFNLIVGKEIINCWPQMENIADVLNS